MGLRPSAVALPEPVVVAPDLEVYPRQAWAGTDHEPVNELFPESVYYLLVHHTETTNEYDEAEVLDELVSLYDQQTGNGWADINYNFYIDRFGRVFEGRAGSIKGPVANDEVGGNIGSGQSICLIGDFTDQEPSTEATDTLIKLSAMLAERHKLEVGAGQTASITSRGSDRYPEGEQVTVATIAAHSDIADSDCPGAAFYPYVSERLPDAVAAYLSTSTTPTTQPEPTTEPTEAPTTTTADTAAPPSTTVPDGSTNSTPTTQRPTSGVTVGQGGDTAFGALLSGAGGGAGVVAITSAIVWVIRRRRSNGL